MATSCIGLAAVPLSAASHLGNGPGPALAWATLTALGPVHPVVSLGGRDRWVDRTLRSKDPESGATCELYAATTDFPPGADILVGRTARPTLARYGLDAGQAWYYQVRATTEAAAPGP